eukprot:NODE_456_length_7225_cov_1.202498.p4 type:complete len:236 gc:universal NODE_456_length_7225_cov_1.202498:2628-1921(-)
MIFALIFGIPMKRVYEGIAIAGALLTGADAFPSLMATRSSSVAANTNTSPNGLKPLYSMLAQSQRQPQSLIKAAADQMYQDESNSLIEKLNLLKEESYKLVPFLRQLEIGAEWRLFLLENEPEKHVSNIRSFIKAHLGELRTGSSDNEDLQSIIGHVKHLREIPAYVEQYIAALEAIKKSSICESEKHMLHSKISKTIELLLSKRSNIHQKSYALTRTLDEVSQIIRFCGIPFSK